MRFFIVHNNGNSFKAILYFLSLELIIGLFSSLFAQNFIRNPGFENILIPPFEPSQLSFASGWSSPSLGSPDLYNQSSDDFGFENEMGKQGALHGNTYAGFNIRTDITFREYLQNTLKFKLEKGKFYKLEIFVSLAEKSPKGIQFLEATFSSDMLMEITKGIIEHNTIYKFNSKDYEFLTNKKGWMHLQLEFQAKGTEQYVQIGSFTKNVPTKGSGSFSYYYVDNVTLNPLPERNGIDKIVLFDSDSWEIRDSDLPKLMTVASIAKSYANLIVTIEGHSDDSGSEMSNDSLSYKRSKSVREFLIKKGVKNKQIVVENYGSREPVASNGSAEGRQRNRRVEISVKDK